MSNYFKYYVGLVGILYHGGGIRPSQLFDSLLEEAEINGSHDILETDIDRISEESFIRRRSLKEYADELIEEVRVKTLVLTGDKANDIAFFYMPMTHNEAEFSFVLCALSRTGNDSGTATVFAPLAEYLRNYADTHHGILKW